MNGYTQIDINGEKVGLKFGMPANRMFAEKLQENFDLLTSNGETNEVGIAYLVYFGYLNNCLIKQEEPKLKFEVFYELAEEAIFNPEVLKVLEAISQVYAESTSTKQWIKMAQEATEQVKKKIEEQTGTLSNHSVTES